MKQPTEKSDPLSELKLVIVLRFVIRILKKPNVYTGFVPKRVLAY